MGVFYATMGDLSSSSGEFYSSGYELWRLMGCVNAMDIQGGDRRLIIQMHYDKMKIWMLPSVNKGPHGFAPQICDSAALLSLSVRPVRFVPVPCRITNLRRKTPSDPKCRLLASGGVSVNRCTLTLGLWGVGVDISRKEVDCDGIV